MPTVLRIGPYRFFFFSNEGNEPPHVHVERDEKAAKFWLNPVRLQQRWGFGDSELSKIQKHVQEHQQLLNEKWHEYFNQ
ncbi:MAG: DUF4160 domain-containing protein [Bacteroidota bacterium]